VPNAIPRGSYSTTAVRRSTANGKTPRCDLRSSPGAVPESRRRPS
jgi:hypothetical protein